MLNAARIVVCSVTLVIFLDCFSSEPCHSQSVSRNFDFPKIVPVKCDTIWNPDNGDGTYTNPIIYADYSDPDVIRVGDNFYLISSSFSQFPGLPILHSNDLVNWLIIGHAVPRYPFGTFNLPQHGNGIWAPSLRYHNGEFYIYFGDPDNGIFMTKTKNPEGSWDSLILVRSAKGWIDPCPFWDDDGNAYLIHAWANSRSGIKSILTINRMSTAGTSLLDAGVTVFDGKVDQPTIEGPKIYKRNGYYYVFAPAGGVKPGWQTVLRSKSIYGPYEVRKILEQGSTLVNGPHQGAWVETQTGESWFIHFQDRDAYGRIVYLQPMRWNDDWPFVGEDFDGNGIGEPVARHRKPDVGRNYPVQVPQTCDEFQTTTLGLQWQWESNPDSSWYSLQSRRGRLRLYSQVLTDTHMNLWTAGNIIGQKIPGPECSVTAKLDGDSLSDGETAGLVILGTDYSFIGIRKTNDSVRVVEGVRVDAEKNGGDSELVAAHVVKGQVFLQLDVRCQGLCSLRYSFDSERFYTLGDEFKAKAGKWVGARLGLFSVRAAAPGRRGFADFDWVRFQRLD